MSLQLTRTICFNCYIVTSKPSFHYKIINSTFCMESALFLFSILTGMCSPRWTVFVRAASAEVARRFPSPVARPSRRPERRFSSWASRYRISFRQFGLVNADHSREQRYRPRPLIFSQLCSLPSTPSCFQLALCLSQSLAVSSILCLELSTRSTHAVTDTRSFEAVVPNNRRVSRYLLTKAMF